MPLSDNPYHQIKLEQLVSIATLGAGGFGRVDLVETPTSERVALKILSKATIAEHGQEDHVLSEKRVLEKLNNTFCISLCATFKDDRYCEKNEKAPSCNKLFHLHIRRFEVSVCLCLSSLCLSHPSSLPSSSSLPSVSHFLRFVYLMMECCLGGELWSRLRVVGRFDEKSARFYTASVIEGMAYLQGLVSVLKCGISFCDLE